VLELKMEIGVEELTKSLIAIPSVSEDEGEVCEFLWDLLTKLDFKPIKILVDKKAFNIVVKIGQPKIYFSGHMDTVPGEVKIREDGKRIWGRGSCDMKGAIASMIVAINRAKEAGMSNFGLILTVGEETEFRGVKKLMKSGLELPFVVVGEPTMMKAINGHFGVLELKLTAKGKKAHSSQIGKGVNAIEKLLEAMAIIKKIKLEKNSTMNLAMIGGGEAVNIVPDTAWARISFRIDPKDKNDYEKQINEKLEKIAKVKKGLAMSSVYCPLPQKLSFLPKGGTVRYMTELSVYKKGLVLGPGSIKQAHGDNEFVEKGQLRKAVEVYGKIIKAYQG
jgi:acetylornithine deacetylase/succinyl-diaminopimelate desuccinylase-like protein